MENWFINHWGDLASAIGLIVTVVGFSIAVTQIIQSRRAAEAAKQAVLETKESLIRNLTIDDLARASLRLQQLKDLHFEREWRRALDRYYDIRVILAEIRSRYPGLTQIQKTTIQSAIQQLEILERVIGRAVHESREPINIQRHAVILLRTQSLLDELSSDIKQSL